MSSRRINLHHRTNIRSLEMNVNIGQPLHSSDIDLENVFAEYVLVQRRLEEAVTSARLQLQVQQSDRLIVSIHARTIEGREVVTYVNVGGNQDLSGDMLFSRILQVLNSAESITPNLRLIFGVQPRSRPRSVQGYSRFRGDIQSFLKNKKSVIQSCIPGMCVYESLAIALSFLCKQKEVRLPFFEQFSYESLVRKPERRKISR